MGQEQRPPEHLLRGDQRHGLQEMGLGEEPGSWMVKLPHVSLHESLGDLCPQCGDHWPLRPEPALWPCQTPSPWGAQACGRQWKAGSCNGMLQLPSLDPEDTLRTPGETGWGDAGARMQGLVRKPILFPRIT